MFNLSILQELSTWILPHYCWSIWKERKNRIFRDREELTLVLGKKIYKNIKENYQVRKGGDIEASGRKMEKEKDRMLKR